MRRIKLILILLLAATTGLFFFAKFQKAVSGVDVGPTMECDQELVNVSVKDGESALISGVTARDRQDGDLTDQIMVSGISKLINADTAKVTCIVFDSDDNMASLVRYIRYTDYQRPTIHMNGSMTFTDAESAQMIAMLSATDVIDGDISDSVRISMLKNTERSNVYSVTAQVTNSMGDTARVELPVILEETNPNRPVIKLSEYLVYLEQGSSFDPDSYIETITAQNRAFAASEVVIDNPVDVNEPGTYWVYYTHTANNITGMTILTVVVQ